MESSVLGAVNRYFSRSETWAHFGFWALGALVFLGMAAKAHFSGVVHDEAYTVDHFTASLYRVWAVYTAPNNHLFNSLLVYYATEIFPGYEHSLRLPAIVSSAVALLCWGGIVHGTIADRPVRFATFAFLALNFYFFDLMVLARGYTFAQSAMLFFVYLMVRYLRGRVALAPLLVLLPLCNIVALGSVLTHALVMAPLNAVFLWSVWCRRALCFQAYGPPRKAWRLAALDTLLAGVIIAIISLFGLLATYVNVLDQVFGLLDESSRVRFWPFLGALFASWFSAGALEVGLLLFLFGVLIARRLWDYRRNGFAWRSINPQNAVVYVVIGAVLLAWFYIDGLGRRIGYPRNLSFLLPLLILLAGVTIDAGIAGVGRAGKVIFWVVSSAVLGVMIIRSLPSPAGVGIEKWNQQTCSAPLAKTLSRIDPARKWNIHFSDEARFSHRTTNFYRQRGYRVRTDEGAPADVKVFHASELTDADLNRRRLLLPEYFARFDCAILKLERF